jgi:HSP20 family protein
MDRWFGGLARPWQLPEWRSIGEEAMVRVEEFVDGDTAVVRAELPGVDPDKDIEITVNDHQLRIRGERRQESSSDSADGYRSEFRYGSFTRVVPLPAGTTDADVKATYRDGVLEVRVPIDRVGAAAKKVAVQRS